MKVWVVSVNNCDENIVKTVCKTKEIAKKYLFEIRDELIKEWGKCHKTHIKELKKFIEKNFKNKKNSGSINDFSKGYVNMYKNMIKNISSDDYESWNNYPHDCPYMYDIELKEK